MGSPIRLGGTASFFSHPATPSRGNQRRNGGYSVAHPLPRGKQKREQGNSSTHPHPRLLRRLQPAFLPHCAPVDRHDRSPFRFWEGIPSRSPGGLFQVRHVVGDGIGLLSTSRLFSSPRPFAWRRPLPLCQFGTHGAYIYTCTFVKSYIQVHTQFIRRTVACRLVHWVAL